MKSGKALGSQYTVEPHTGQKCKVAKLPLSPTRENAVERPSMEEMSSRRNRACVPKTLPVLR